MDNENATRNRINAAMAWPAIIAALYLPQIWFFLIDYPWSSYRLYWLKFLPGLPLFFPCFLLTHRFSDLVSMILPAVCVAAEMAGLFWLSRKAFLAFWLALAAACALSIFSALGAHSVFVM